MLNFFSVPTLSKGLVSNIGASCPNLDIVIVSASMTKEAFDSIFRNFKLLTVASVMDSSSSSKLSIDESSENLISDSAHLAVLKINLPRFQATRLLHRSKSLKLIRSKNFSLTKSSLTFGEAKEFQKIPFLGDFLEYQTVGVVKVP